MQNVFDQTWPPKPYVWRVFLHHDLILIRRKNGSKTRMTFSTRKQNSPLKNTLLGITVHKICMLWIRVVFESFIESFFAIRYPDIFLSVNRINEVTLLMSFNPPCKSSNSLWNSPSKPFLWKQKDIACGLCYVCTIDALCFIRNALPKQ